jgi:hypothetical protein
MIEYGTVKRTMDVCVIDRWVVVYKRFFLRALRALRLLVFITSDFDCYHARATDREKSDRM